MLKLGAVATALLGAVYAQQNSSLPIIDLGYELHQASDFNSTGRFYNFSNIRYAAPPLGNLRFAPPQAPAVDRSTVNNGSIGKICPQGNPAWGATATQFLTNLLLGLPANSTPAYQIPQVNASTPLPPQDPRTDEDCLFLDVFVPEQILENADQGYGAAVLVWIYGGGYVNGNKDNNPAGLLAASGNVSDGEVIYVALNYRLGAFGFSSGPSFNAEGGTSNAALYDQRFALEWVQKYIHLFGGDPERVTVFGESAGGGSIMHQITAYGGTNGSVPFQQAVPQSPGWVPVNSNLQQEDTYRNFLNMTNATNLAELRALSTEELMRANYFQIYQAPYSTYAYGPVVDGGFVPQQPAQLLAQGKFDKDVRVMVGHNADEGAYFTPPTVVDEASAMEQIRVVFPYMPQASIDYILNVLYPPVFDGSYGYTTYYGRAAIIAGEGIFTCNTNYLGTAFDNETYSYLFAVPPAFHGLDVSFTYYDGGAVGTLPYTATNRTIAIALQDFITSFAINGRPSADNIVKFEMYGPNAQVLDLNVTGIMEVTDSNANNRCKWWQLALYT